MCVCVWKFVVVSKHLFFYVHKIAAAHLSIQPKKKKNKSKLYTQIIIDSRFSFWYKFCLCIVCVPLLCKKKINEKDIFSSFGFELVRWLIWWKLCKSKTVCICVCPDCAPHVLRQKRNTLLKIGRTSIFFFRIVCETSEKNVTVTPVGCVYDTELCIISQPKQVPWKLCVMNNVRRNIIRAHIHKAVTAFFRLTKFVVLLLK